MTMRLLVLIPFTTISVLLLLRSASPGEPSRPNILFMLTDDQRFDDLGCMGNKIIQTPHIDRLAADGVIFENAKAYEPSGGTRK